MTPTRAQSSASVSKQWRAAGHDERRDLIIQAALRLLDRHGRHGVTMRRVAQRMGVGTMTLYTYFDSQQALLREVCKLGFDMLHGMCEANSSQKTDDNWHGGSRAYVAFAIEHPKLYELMFSAPVSEGGTDTTILRGGLECLLEIVRQRLASKGLTGDALEDEALRQAGRYWIGLHGLASLACAGRLDALGGNLDRLHRDLLERIAPD